MRRPSCTIHSTCPETVRMAVPDLESVLKYARNVYGRPMAQSPQTFNMPECPPAR